MARWREKLFIWMNRNALRATDFFQSPANSVVELGGNSNSECAAWRPLNSSQSTPHCCSRLRMIDSRPWAYHEARGHHETLYPIDTRHLHDETGAQNVSPLAELSKIRARITRQYQSPSPKAPKPPNVTATKSAMPP
ncbi:hypothetical protein ACEUBB_19985 [Aeromonas rivipollensis]|uniref:KUP/HAK/KT family potassium transporter n=1 Tax=Aeromonas rivipollensis TaxID=948519 RepID=UPI0038D1BD79